MAVAHYTRTVGTAAVDLLAGTADTTFQPYTKTETQRSVVLTNAGSVDVCLGGPNVTAASYGYALTPGERLALDLVAGDVVYAIVASGSGSVRMLHLGV